MTRLLVSVRSGDEAESALAGGADLIDVKEPHRGALGPADAAVIRDVLARVAGRTPVSAALGELAALGKNGSATPRPVDLPPGLRYAKLGLAGCAEAKHWRSQWTEILAQLTRGISPVAVVYADWRSAAAPQPADILETAQQYGCPALLVDTFDKNRGGLLDHWPFEQLAPFVAQVRASGMKIVLAGSLEGTQLAQVLPLEPDYVAFRGAVCSGGRAGDVDRQLVARLARQVHRAEAICRPRK